jgi:hypothetical protein
MKSIFETALKSSHSYTNYRNIVTQLLSEGKATGKEQSEDLLHYSELNQVRMNRLDKTIHITEENCAKLKSIQQPQIWLVLSEGWCGDAAQILPILNKMAICSDQITLKIVFRDENEELMQQFLTNGTKSIPKLIILNKENLEFIADFGPRPTGAKQLILDYKAKHGVVDEMAKTELQKWYLHDKGLSTQHEILEKITSTILQNHSE